MLSSLNVMAEGFKQAATEGNSSGGLIHQRTAASFTHHRLLCVAPPPPPPPQCNPLCFYLTDQLTSRQPKNYGNPVAWCVTAELSVSAAHARVYLQQAITVYQFTVVC